MTTAPRLRHLAAAALLALLAASLYLPYLANPPIFDDRNFLSGFRFEYYATHPLGLDRRLPGYFTLAMTEILVGGIPAQRVVGLLLHIGCALVLYRLLYALQRVAPPGATAAQPAAFDAPAAVRATVGAAAFALHPVAVYGAGYLIQRSIVLATLFSLLSLVFFLRGLQRGSHADAVWAALWYSLAVLSKEHAVLLPGAALPLAWLSGAGRRFALRHAALYLAACAPAAVFVTLLSVGVIGRPYEPEFDQVAAQMGDASGRAFTATPLALSAVTQAGLFFRYLGLWLWPDTAGMSIDLRVDFLGAWTAGWIALKVLAFLAAGALGAALLRKRGAAGLCGFGLLYFWILFLVEFTAARYQEPFVLYRSYLWGPGVACIAAGLLALLPPRAAAVAGALACVLLAYGAHDRLGTFANPLRLWEDAAAKLPPQPVPWGSRTLYNLGREYLYTEQPAKALATAERCAALYPQTAQCHYARGVIHLHLGEFEAAREHLARTLQLLPSAGVVHHRMGLALEGLGRIEEAKASYHAASKLGFKGADFELERLASPPKEKTGGRR
jgi:tetratricopeptide (TPR) repeat protein